MFEYTYQISDHIKASLVELSVEGIISRDINWDAVRMGSGANTILKSNSYIVRMGPGTSIILKN
jgi:hypothetical protein